MTSESDVGVTSWSAEVSPSVQSLHGRVSALNWSLSETRQRADVDRRRVDDALTGLAEVYADWDERWRHVEVTLINGSLEHCRRANAELLVDVQLTQLSDKTTALDGRTTQLTTDVDRSVAWSSGRASVFGR